MTQPTQLTGQVYAVEVKECMNAFNVECRPEIDFYVLNCYQLGEYDEPVNEDSIDLPAGDWEYLCTTEEASGKGTITGEGESLPDLMAEKGLVENKNYVLIKKL